MSIGTPITTGYTPIIPAAGAVSWDGPLSALLQALIDAVEARASASGLDIQGSLTLNGNQIVDVLGARFTVAATDPGVANSLFMSGSTSEWYLRDGSNNRIQVTAGGFLNVQGSGSIGGDYSNSSAAATYTNSNASFRWTASPGVYATMENGAVRIHNGSSAGYVGLAVQAAQASNITLTFPTALPATRTFVTVDATGSLGYDATMTRDSRGLIVSGSTMFSGTIGYTKRTKVIHASLATPTNLGAGTPVYAGGSQRWQLAADSSVDFPLDFDIGNRVLGVTVYHQRTLGVTSSLEQFYLPAGTGTVATLASTVSSTGSEWTTMRVAPAVPYTFSATGSLTLRVKGAGTPENVGIVLVDYDFPVV